MKFDWIYLLVIPAIRFLIYSNDYFYLRKVIRKHEVYVNGIIKKSSQQNKRKSEKAGKWIQGNQIEIRNRILKSGLHDPVLSRMEPLGLGYARQQNMSPLDNLLFENAEILGRAREAMERAKGYFRGQALKSLNPIYWLELIVFLPKEIAKITGIKTDSKTSQGVINFVQVIYWIVSIAYTITKFTEN